MVCHVGIHVEFLCVMNLSWPLDFYILMFCIPIHCVFDASHLDHEHGFGTCIHQLSLLNSAFGKSFVTLRRGVGECILAHEQMLWMRNDKIAKYILACLLVSTLEREEQVCTSIPLSCGHRIGGGSNRHLIHVGLLRRPKFFFFLACLHHSNVTFVVFTPSHHVLCASYLDHGLGFMHSKIYVHCIQQQITLQGLETNFPCPSTHTHTYPNFSSLHHIGPISLCNERPILGLNLSFLRKFTRI